MDASNGVVAEALSQQHDEGIWFSVSFFFCIMNGLKQNYNIHNKELLVIVQVLTEWRSELEELQRMDWFNMYINH